ncbi:MAG: tetratricopeptide repeat protein [Marinilabiliaceae bacterium]|jgi:tetratricopeptide (TPR) repeat protein|nr:tetratricopeptide repeat protein [Marinilabiliaceae bacterium]
MTYNHLKLILLSILIFLPAAIFSQGTEISVTTVSEEAREAFIKGRQKKENIQLEAAEMLFNRAIELDPQFALAYSYRAYPGDHEKAIELIDKVSEGERLTIRYFKANDYYELKEANDYLGQLLEKYPSSKHVHLWAGLFYENILHDYQLALDHFHIASKLDDKYAAPHNEIGYRHMRLGNFEKAEEAFKKYIELAPECPNAYDSYANFLMKLKRYGESIQQYSEVYNLNPDKIVTIARIGQNYAFRGEFDEARSYYDKYYREADNTGQKVLALGLSAASYLVEGKLDEALKKIEECIDLGESTASNVEIITSTANLAFIQIELGNKEEGLKKYQEVASLLKKLDLPEATANRYIFSSYGWLARAYAANGEFRKAEDNLNRVKRIVDRTNNPLYKNEYQLYRGSVDLERGKYENAVESLQLCDLDNPFNIYILARAYSLSGNADSAFDLIELLDSWEDFGLDYSVARIKAQELSED